MTARGPVFQSLPEFRRGETMSQIHTVIEALPEPVRRPVEQAWATLPAEQRQEAEGVLKLLPTSLRPLKDVLGFVLDQYKPLLGSKRSIAVVGPANVGKSTL
jgi:ribosome biogenesis GTPase A